MFIRFESVCAVLPEAQLEASLWSSFRFRPRVDNFTVRCGL